MARDWLDDDGRLLFGRHKGEMAENVASSDPGYIRWILENVEDLAEEDYEILETLLSWKSHTSRRSMSRRLGDKMNPEPRR